MLKKPDSGFLVWTGFFVGLCLAGPSGVLEAQAQENCEPVQLKPVKIEAWMSKRQEPVFKLIRREFAEMGHTRVTLWRYPAQNPSKVAAIGRCVPAYIAQHALRKALEFSGGVNGLVHQGFFSSHWIGIGTSLFAESSYNKISSEQLDQLLDASLDTYEFQSLYRSFTLQETQVEAFGLTLPNPKLLKED
ncbi:MAG: hypothetical protein NPINA01_15110 [Nitrospinaceae bacterium]|nr:MAG: hypothetical protein NPINA01_15110 [Nitrospinaceae bacterium]